ncbi:MAG: sulfatase-like hydrolase/transferase, partial [Phycisphaerae bacterium]|nr:sulfatase-like hydrolase/transferase [Phycisphaerae bacterium]
FRSWQRRTNDPFADPDKLQRFTRSQLNAIGSDYRSNKTFRWPYLDEFKQVPGETPAERPNVLFIAIDDLRPELGCYGDGHIVSPNIDALAASGVRFDRAYCQQALCGPSRASLLTGLRPDSARIHGNHTHYRTQYPAVVTLPQYFKDQGYHTRALGKINHGVFPPGSSRTVADTFGDKPSWSIPAFRPGPRYYYTEAGIAAARKVYERIYKPENPGPDDWTRKLVFGPASEAPEVADSVLYDGQVADRAIASLAELSGKRGRPFFLAVGFIKPHSPYIAPQKYWDLYDPAKIAIAGQAAFPSHAPRISLHNSGELRRYTDQPKAGPIANKDQRRIKHAYFACISYIDAQVGRVLAALDKQGLGDNTIVVLWGDHGYHLGEQNLWGKTTNFELDTRIPLIVRAPGRAGNGRSTEALVELVDLYPTLADLCGLPGRSLLEGSSFAPLLDNPQRPWKTAAFSQTTRGKIRGYSIRTATHRYTQWQNLQTSDVVARELYLYEQDSYPVEQANLAEAEPDLVRSLSGRLAAGHGWKSVRRELPKPAAAGVQLARIFTDHMVLPRDRPIPIWGTAASGTKVAVSYGDQKHTTVTDREGRWQISLRAIAASTMPRNLVVNNHVLRDVVVGDIWFCSGQSNMRWMLKQSDGAQAAIASAGDSPHLRLLDLTAEIYPRSKVYGLDRLRKTTADNYYAWSGWQRAAPAPAATFSAVAWHFGKRLLEQNPNVPIGLIHNAIGGTPMESWIPEATLLADRELQQLVTIPWHAEAHPRYPRWCGLRGRQNLAEYFGAPDGPAPNHPFKPGFLYDAGVRPLIQLPITGVIWYQGESNATQDGAGSSPTDAAWNRNLFTTLIRSWRNAWKSPRLPFIFAQLPGLNRDWPLFRELQLQVAQADPDVHMAVTIDSGHPTNVHPTNKRPVGRRMAELALGVARSPVVRDLKPGEITFDQPLRATDGKPIRGFGLAGADRVFHPASAKIRGRNILLTSEKVPNPVAVRYGWENDPDLNLAGLQGGHPVSPFRSDRWQVKASAQPATATGPATSLTGFETPRAGPLTKAT